jgi:TrkA domain protein
LKVKKDRIPEIGNKYTIEIDENKLLIIISHYNGKKEVFFIENNNIKCSLTLSEEEAKEIGFILSDLKEFDDETIPLVKDKIVMDWFLIKKNFCAVNKKIKDLKIRTRTGASIVAVERDSEVISSISPETEFKEGDKVLIVGNLISVEKAKKIMRDCEKSKEKTKNK